MHGTLDKPELEGVDSATRAVMVGDAARWAWIYDPNRSAEELLAQAAEVAVGEASYKRETTRVISLAIATTEPEASANNAPQVEAVRQAAVAGAFYPGEPDQLARAIDEFLPSQAKPERWAGAMVPHAGWTYSGRLGGRGIESGGDTRADDRLLSPASAGRSGLGGSAAQNMVATRCGRGIGPRVSSTTGRGNRRTGTRLRRASRRTRHRGPIADPRPAGPAHESGSALPSAAAI